MVLHELMLASDSEAGVSTKHVLLPICEGVIGNDYDYDDDNSDDEHRDHDNDNDGEAPYR